MFDTLRNRYALTCPTSGDRVLVAVSSFRVVRRLRGATSPAVFRVQFDCDCGDRHEALVAHDHLDWSPLGTDSTETYMNLVTGRRELVALELVDQATDLLRKGSWPWSFWCHPESSLRPGFPSSLRFVSPEHAHGGNRVGVLVRCFSCQRHTVNIVSTDHLDVPWHNDEAITFIPQVFDRDQLQPEERFRHQLHDATAQTRWLRDAG
ncbi:MAG: hypothetical protein JWO69_39 [Thermoleophilia bacterium]|jgi:hypothetical protein|nr:hypothetical protein [Thermoleophilia bacterium]